MAGPRAHISNPLAVTLYFAGAFTLNANGGHCHFENAEPSFGRLGLRPLGTACAEPCGTRSRRGPYVCKAYLRDSAL